MHLYRGCYPLLYPLPAAATWTEDVEARIDFGIEYLKKTGHVKDGANVVVIHGETPSVGTKLFPDAKIKRGNAECNAMKIRMSV